TGLLETGFYARAVDGLLAGLPASQMPISACVNSAPVSLCFLPKGHLLMTATTLQPAPGETSAAAVSGLVELADGHAFVRAAGYRRGPADVYISAAQIRQYGLRTGDWVLGTAGPEGRG